MTCGVPGTWTISYQLSPNGTSGWESRQVAAPGFSDDNLFWQSKTLSGCTRSSDILSGCNGRTVFANITCNAFIRNISYQFVPEQVRFDCLNGTCVPSTQYDTEGTYQSLVECEAVCGSGSGCNGECVSKAKLSQLKNLSNRLKRKNCGC
ncbi:MAG: hypothetical protein QNJ36_16885 [Calothrix sp. MO_167.B42]|nr:hypothetical protein [Calothrix sp. MO_167.B42]